MTFLRWCLELMDLCYCRTLPEDEDKRENTDDTILPVDFIPMNENNHQNPFDTDTQLSQFIRNTQICFVSLNILPIHDILKIQDLQYGL